MIDDGVKKSVEGTERTHSQRLPSSAAGWLIAVIVLSGAVSAGQACKASTEETSISRERYVTLYVEILRARAAAADSAAAAESTSAVLARHGVTEDDLDEFAQSHAHEPAYLASVWGEIANRLREPQTPDSASGE